MAESKRWIVTTSGRRSPKDVSRDIESAGLAVDEVLEEIGVITGSASDSVAERVRGVPGVADVSPDQPIDIGPPDSPTTW